MKQKDKVTLRQLSEITGITQTTININVKELMKCLPLNTDKRG